MNYLCQPGNVVNWLLWIYPPLHPPDEARGAQDKRSRTSVLSVDSWMLSVVQSSNAQHSISTSLCQSGRSICVYSASAALTVSSSAWRCCLVTLLHDDQRALTLPSLCKHRAAVIIMFVIMCSEEQSTNQVIWWSLSPHLLSNPYILYSVCSYPVASGIINHEEDFYSSYKPLNVLLLFIYCFHIPLSYNAHSVISPNKQKAQNRDLFHCFLRLVTLLSKHTTRRQVF